MSIIGLDNGLIIKPKTINGEIFLRENFPELKDKYSSDVEYEFGYWRKCWNIRSKFFEYFPSDDINDTHIYLNIGDLIVVIEKVLKYFLDENNWDREETIWDWEIQLPNIANTIRDLRFFLQDVKDKGLSNFDFEIYFYDSY